MKNISYSLSIMIALGLLCHAPAQSAVIEKARKKDIQRYNDLEKTIKDTSINMPGVLVTIITGYAHEKQPLLTPPITIYQEKGTEQFLHKIGYYFPQKQHHEYRKRTNTLSVAIEYSDPTQVSGHEFRTAVADASGLQRDHITLQEWSHDDERYDEGRIISDTTSYPPDDLPRYTFGVKIKPDQRSAVQELITSQRTSHRQGARQPGKTTNNPLASSHKTCKDLIIKPITLLYSSLSQLNIR